MRKLIALAALLLACTGLPARAAEPDAPALFLKHCAECHGQDRLGAIGPALLPENLGRLRQKAAIGTITSGRPQTQMPAFNETLSEAEIKALAAYIYTPLGAIPEWGEAQIAASRELAEDAPKADKPRFTADPLNLFVVVETGDHHATILDGDTFTPLHRFQTRFALHGGPKFTPDGRYVFFMSRDGWVTKYDLWTFTVLGEVRAGVNSRNIALSGDGRHIAVANYLPHSLVILSADDLSVEKIFPVADDKGNTSRVSAVYTAPPRDSFIAALKDIKEVWEIRYDDNPPPGFGQPWIHDYRPESGDAPQAERFPRRRIKVEQYLDDFFFDQGYVNLIGASREGQAHVINMDVRRTIATLDLQGLPHLGSGITWQWQGRTVMATPHLKEGKVSIIDMEDWKIVKTLDTLGPGFFMRSHQNSPYAWVDVFFGPHKDAMHVIDKKTLEIVKTLKPAPGKTVAHVEYDRSGRHAIVSVWEKDGEIIVYDADTLTEIKRLPMSKPSGKYNVWNKINYEEGTSH